MNQKIKNLLGSAIALVVLLVGYAAVSYVNSYDKSIQPSSFRSFSVSGDGKATGIPDIAQFSFTVLTEGGKDVASLQAKNTDSMNKAIAFVKSKGVEDKDIKTEYYNVDPRYQTYNCNPSPIPMYSIGSSAAGGSAVGASSVQPCPPASITGYTITQSVSVKIRDFGKIGDIMSGVVTNGANQVSSLSFTIDDPSKVQNEARAEAIAKAKAKAEGIAQAGGFRIGRLLSVQEGGVNPYMYDKYAFSSALGLGMKTEASAPAPSIQPGSQDVTVNITLQYEIQ